MYAGEIVEVGDTFSLFGQPLHPYTQALLSSLPSQKAGRGQLKTIDGTVPDLSDLPAGCRFHPRCPHAKSICHHQSPPRVQVADGREVACVLYGE